ncbi:MAG TPA: hypothetical protein DEF34_00875 [Desulfotomaculum sp.]|nr:hypothetical protein [Desulfotomaculum sp.]
MVNDGKNKSFKTADDSHKHIKQHYEKTGAGKDYPPSSSTENAVVDRFHHGKKPSTPGFIVESLRLNLFWLRIMSEHALFIRLGLPCEEVALRLEAEQLQKEFARLLDEAQQIAENPTKNEVFRLNREAINLTTAIIDFKSRVLQLIICCDIVTGFNLPLLIDHIRREAIFFRASLVRLQEGLTVGSVEELIQSQLFWLRIMADHSKFILHLLDPSERRFIGIAREFSDLFDQLRLHARDFESMLVPQTFENSLLDDTDPVVLRPGVFGEGLPEPFSIGSLDRFTEEAIAATAELRDFKQTARELIERCRVLSIISPLLADHVFREAVRAVEDLTMLERLLPPPCEFKPDDQKKLHGDPCYTREQEFPAGEKPSPKGFLNPSAKGANPEPSGAHR